MKLFATVPAQSYCQLAALTHVNLVCDRTRKSQGKEWWALIPPERKILQISLAEALTDHRIPPSDSDTMAGVISWLQEAPLTQAQDAISQGTCQGLPYKAMVPLLAPVALVRT